MSTTWHPRRSPLSPNPHPTILLGWSHAGTRIPSTTTWPFLGGRAAAQSNYDELGRQADAADAAVVRYAATNTHRPPHAALS